jgi:hypothetical protein
MRIANCSRRYRTHHFVHDYAGVINTALHDHFCNSDANRKPLARRQAVLLQYFCLGNQDHA